MTFGKAGCRFQGIPARQKKRKEQWEGNPIGKHMLLSLLLKTNYITTEVLHLIAKKEFAHLENEFSGKERVSTWFNVPVPHSELHPRDYQNPFMEELPPRLK